MANKAIKENVLIESKTAREETLERVTEEKLDEVFNKIKGLVLLPDNTNVTTEMVANYFEVDKKLIEYHVKANKDELTEDGLKTIKGEELKELLTKVCNPVILGSKNPSKIRSLTLIPRRAILRLGMLIQKSEIAKQIRTYLLNVEENTDVNTKLISITQDTYDNIITLQDDVKTLEKYNELILSENEELKTNTYLLINKIDDILQQPLFKLYHNQSSEYEKLIIEFTDIMRSKNYCNNNYGKDYALFNSEFSKWTGIDFGTKKINKKEYWLNYYGLKIIEHFIFGIKQGSIVKNKNNYWVDLNGIYCNKVEWRRTLETFENKCIYCGSNEILIAEHITPQSNDKSTDIVYNIIPSCSKCNKDKSNMSMKEWLNIRQKKGMTKIQIDKIRQHWKKYYIEEK